MKGSISFLALPHLYGFAIATNPLIFLIHNLAQNVITVGNVSFFDTCPQWKLKLTANRAFCVNDRTGIISRGEGEGATCPIPMLF